MLIPYSIYGFVGVLNSHLDSIIAWLRTNELRRILDTMKMMMFEELVYFGVVAWLVLDGMVLSLLLMAAVLGGSPGCNTVLECQSGGSGQQHCFSLNCYASCTISWARMIWMY